MKIIREVMKYKISKLREKTLIWIAWHLPEELVKWCYIRVGANATTGKYSGTDTTDITMIDALHRWK